MPELLVPNTEIKADNTEGKFVELAKNPELISNAPLESTSLVISVPVRAEWGNGKMLRFLDSMFSQKNQESSSIEVQILLNSGLDLYESLVKEKGKIKKDSEGRYLQKPSEKLDQIKQDNEDARQFLQSLVVAQQLARRGGENDLKHIQEHADKIEDPLQKAIFEQSVKKANEISLLAVDASNSYLPDQGYKLEPIEAVRTLGADIAYTRFEKKPDTVLMLFDIDTVPEKNTSLEDIQDIFNKHQELQYLFLGLSYLPSGDTKELLSDSPRASIESTAYYGQWLTKGSPQIAFTLNAYKKIHDISGTKNIDFGDEDRGTAFRLMSHFNDIDLGTLFEESGIIVPTVLTSDRSQGFVDSAYRMQALKEKGIRSVLEDNTTLQLLGKKIETVLEKLPAEKEEKAREYLAKVREHYFKSQRLQQRMNRRVIKTLLQAFDSEQIQLTESNDLKLDRATIIALPGGKALLHYIDANAHIVAEVLNNPQDRSYIQYLLDSDSNETIEHPLTPAQKAFREYLGQPITYQELLDSQKIKVDNKETKDLRNNTDKVSLLHGITAELLALGQIYKAFHLQDELKDYWEKTDFSGRLTETVFRETTEKEQSTRIRNIKNTYPQIRSFSLFEKLFLKSFPLMDAFNFLKRN